MATKKVTVSELGSIVMYGLSVDLHIPYADFFKEAEKNGVPLHLLPMPLSPTGAFKRSTTGLKETFQKMEEPIFIKEVPSTKENIIMRTFEKRIKSSKEDTERMEKGKQYIPTYKPIVTIMFDTFTSDMTYQLFEKEGKEIFRKVQDRYNELCGMANIQQVRATIQNAFRYYGSIKLRGNGGVDFIPAQHLQEWRNVTNFLDKFNGIDIKEFDLSVSPRNKKEIEDSLYDDIGDSICDEIKKLNGKTTGSNSLNELITEFSKVLKENQSSKDALKNGALETMLNRYNETMEKVKLYKELLNTDLSVIDSQIEIAKSQLMTIVNKAA